MFLSFKNIDNLLGFVIYLMVSVVLSHLRWALGLVIFYSYDIIGLVL